MILVLDTETVGVPKNYKAPPTDTNNWPRAVQISWATFKDNGQQIAEYDYIIRPDGFIIPPETTLIHRISQEHAELVGVDILEVLDTLSRFIHLSGIVIGHNIDFDRCIVGAEFHRAKLDDPFEKARIVCTMKSPVADFCNIPGPYGPKWPKLAELYGILFPGEIISGAHNASVDVTACARCYFELVEKNILPPPERLRK